LDYLEREVEEMERKSIQGGISLGWSHTLGQALCDHETAHTVDKIQPTDIEKAYPVVEKLIRTLDAS
jgi:hypothetical protein